jgi:CheY-like chemotaxis protein
LYLALLECAVVSVTAGQADRCREAGMDDYLSKPVPLADLKAILEQCCPYSTRR